MKILLCGGSKSGKSYLGQRLAKKLAGDGPMYYLATMIPGDSEDLARIDRHREDRAGWGFETVECGRDLLQALERMDRAGTVLLDSVTALLANEMFSGGEMDRNAPWRTSEELRCLGQRCRNVIYIADDIFSDAGRYEETTEFYRRGLAQVDRILAEQCDTVAELCSGIPVLFKGKLP